MNPDLPTPAAAPRSPPQPAPGRDQEHYRAILEFSEDAIIGKTIEGTVLSWNPAAERMYGYTAAEMLGQAIDRLIPPDRTEEHARIMEQVRCGTCVRHLETVRVCKDGRRLDVRLNVAPIQDAAGAILGASVITRDLTRPKQAETALAHERFLMDTLMEHISDKIYFKDRQSRFMRVNRAMAVVFKVADPAEVIGKTDFDFFTVEHAQQAFQDEQRIMLTGQPLVGREEKETWPDGSVTWVSTTKQCLLDDRGEVIGTFGISRNITARKLAEGRLHESEERLQSILDATSAVIYVKDRQGRYLLINRQFEALFHLTRDQIRGRSDHDIFPQQAADAFRVNDLKALANEQPLEFEEIAPQDDGPHTYLSIKFRLYDASGAPYAVCGISTDITERKRAEEELKRTAVELARSNADLEQFAYAASHDLQEPLRMIASYLQLLVRRYQGKLDQDADDFIGFAVDGARRMQGLINDLLAYSRVGTRGRPFETTDCGDALKQALANLRVALEECSAVVTHDGLPRVMGDGPQLAQLFQNLISNCIKFRSAAPPEIRVSARLGPALTGAAGARRPGTYPAAEWVISVQDNGIGIDREHFERIFIIFQRLHTRDRYPGTGIGLSICKKIIERHGGRIWVESEPGQGAAFHFTLPQADATPRDGGNPP